MMYKKSGFRRTIMLLILVSYTSSCVTVGSMSLKNNLHDTKNSLWITPKGKEKPKAVVVLLHGLNLRPEKMDGWAKTLSDHGALVMRFSLYGHSGEVEEMRNVSAEIWRKNVSDHVEEARKKADELSLPLYFVGFSLGALLGLDWMAHQSSDKHNFERAVLIAPAISLPWYSKKAVKFFSIFGKNTVLPSRSPKEYRATKGTSVAAYEALFAIRDELDQSKFKNCNVDTLLIMDFNDELVSSKGVKEIANKYSLSRWNLKFVDNQRAHKNYGFRHLMVDQEALGERLWTTLSAEVLRHLSL